MPRLPRGFELSAYELALLVRALTDEQRYALIDSGWGDDLRAAFDFAMRHLPELGPIWESRLNAVPDGWLESFMLMFWDEAVPLLVENPRKPDARPVGVAADPPPRSRRPRQAKRETYGHPDTKYPSEQVAETVRRWREGGKRPNVSEISRRTALSRPLVNRIGRLDGHGAFELGPRGGLRLLGADRKFRAAGASVSIRSLERALGLPSQA